MAGNTVSIGFDYRKQLDKAVKDIENTVNKALGSGSYGKEFEKQIASFKDMLAELKDGLNDSFKGISTGKLDTDKFDAFRAKVTRDFQKVDGEIDSLNKSMKTLNDLLGISGEGVDLSSAINQFKELQNYINANNDAVTKLLKTLKKSNTDLVFDAPSFSINDAKSKIEKLNELISDEGKSFGGQKSKELQNNYKALSKELQDLLEQSYALEDQLAETNKSDPMFLKMQAELSETELKLKNVSAALSEIHQIANEKGYSWNKNVDTYEWSQILDIDNLKNIEAKVKSTLSELDNYIKDMASSSAVISEKIEDGVGSVNIQVRIGTRDNTLRKELEEKISKLQSHLNANPLIFPVKMVVSNARTTSENPLKTSADAIKKAQKALQDETSNVQMNTDDLPKQTLKQALINAERAAKESQKRIQEVFDAVPIQVHFEVPTSEIEKVSRAIFDENGETKIDISDQIDRTIKRVDALVLKLKDVDKQVNETKKNNRFLGLSEEIKKSLTDLSALKDILNSIKDLETTIARGMNVSTSDDITRQWNNVKFWFDYISDESHSLDFTKQTKQISTLMDEYQKYVNMGGKNPLRNLTDNEETVVGLYDEFRKLNSVSNLPDFSSTENESFTDVKKSVDDLAVAIGETKVDAINKEMDVMREASASEINSIKAIEDEALKLIQLFSKKISFNINYDEKEFSDNIRNIIADASKNTDLSLKDQAKKAGNNIAKLIIDMLVADDAMRQKVSKVNERGVYYNSKTGKHTNPYPYGTPYRINRGLQSIGFNDVEPDSHFHTHPNKRYASLSIFGKSFDELGDFFNSLKDYRVGINKQLVVAQKEVEIFNAKDFYDAYYDKIEKMSDDQLRELYDSLHESLDRVINNAKLLSSSLKNIEIPYEDILPKNKISDDLNNSNMLNKKFTSEYFKFAKNQEGISPIESLKKYLFKIFDEQKILNRYSTDEINQYVEEFASNFNNWLTKSSGGRGKIYHKATSIALSKVLGIKNWGSFTEHLSIEDFNKKFTDEYGNNINRDELENIGINISPIINIDDFIGTIQNAIKDSFINVNIKPLFSEEDLLNQIKLTLENKTTDVQKTKKKRNKKQTRISNTNDSVNTINSETTALDTVAESAKKAALAKDGFNKSNELLAIGASESADAIKNEVTALSTVGKEIENIDLDKNSEEFKNAAKSAKQYFNELGEIASITKTSGTYNTYNRHTGKTEQFLRTSYRITDVNGNSRTIDPQGNLIGSKDIINVTSSYRDYLKIQEEIYALNLKEAKGQQLTEEELSKRLKLLNDIQNQSDILFDLEQKGLENAELRDEILRRQQSYEQTIIDAKTKSLVTKPIEDFEGKLSKLDTNKNLSKQTYEYKTRLEEIRNLINELKSYENSGITLFDPETESEVNRIKEQVTSLFSTISDMDKAANQAKATSLISNIEDYLAKNSSLGMSSKGRGFISELRGLQNELKNADLTSPGLQDIVIKFNNIKTAITEAGLAGRSFFDVIKSKAFYMAAETLARLFSINDIIRYGRTIYNTVRELDTALVDLRKTAKMSNSELDNFYKSSNAVAKQMGVTTKEIINQAAAWSRLGYSTANQAEKMAALSSQFSAVSPDMDVNQATDGLVSSMKAFKIEVDNVERDVMDNINRIGNTMATTNGEIVDMLTRSSAAMAAANNTIQETIALESAAVEITRNAETTGTAFKTVAMRIRGYDEETEELSEDLKNISGDIADLTKVAGKGGISLFTDETKQTYKSTYQILKEISDIWNQLSDKNQAQLLEKISGKRGAQVVAGVISNFSAAEKAMEEMKNAAGSADAEMAIIESSIDYKINKFKETWVGVAQELIDRGDIGKFIDGLTSISEAIALVTKNLGLLSTAGLIGGTILGAKNLGRGKMFPLKPLTI